MRGFVKFFTSVALSFVAVFVFVGKDVLADWSSVTNVSNNSGLSVYSSIVADSSSVLHTV